MSEKIERLTLAKAITRGLEDAMEADRTVVMLGEDIGKLGGVYRVTEGLQAPVIRVGGYYMPYPVSRVEEEYVPDIDRILEAVDRAFDY